MLEISTGKIVRVIMLTREYGPDSVRLSDYISGLNEDEKTNLVAVMGAVARIPPALISRRSVPFRML